MSQIQQIIEAEKIIKTFPQAEIETRHYFAGGVYEREIIVPAGMVITGKIHLTEHLAKLVKGTMSLIGSEGSGTFTGPVTFKSSPGAKRIGYAHDDVVFSTFHAVGGCTDLVEIEAALVVNTPEEYEQRIGLIGRSSEQLHIEGGL